MPLRSSSRTLVKLLAVVALSAPLAAAVPTGAQAAVGDCTPAAGWPAARPDLEATVVGLVNAHRTSMGLSALVTSPSLTAAAEWKARHMAAYGYLAHDDPAPPVARTVADRLTACGYPASSAGWGENIAYGYPTAAAVVDGWLGSPGHRANIETAAFRATGVGAAASPGGTLYWSQEFGTSTSGAPAPTPTPAPAAPTVALTSAPPSSTTATSASFAWTTTGSPTSVTCSLDGRTATTCTSPTTVSGLAVGSHSFRVTVANAGGTAAASHSWTVSAPTAGVAPTVKLTSKPPLFSALRSATVTWTTSGSPTSVSCKLDGAAAVPCSSPRTVTFARGWHTMTVTVANDAGSARATALWWAS